MSPGEELFRSVRILRQAVIGRRTLLIVSDRPHLDLEATEVLRGALTNGVVFVEYGAGGSTLLAAGGGSVVISAELSRRWAVAVSRALPAHADARSKVLHADVGITGDWGWPFDRRQTQRNVARWTNYVKCPWTYLQSLGLCPEVVLVDGRFRVACAAFSMMVSAKNGWSPRIFVDDYRDRPQYQVLETIGLCVCMHGRMAEFVLRTPFDETLAMSTFEQYITVPE